MTTSTDVRTARVALLPGDGERARLELRTGLLAPRVARRAAASAEVALVATTASLLGGDELRLDVEVGPGLRLELHDVAGTVAYHGRGRGSLVAVSLAVHPGALLVWQGEPLVVCDGAEVVRTLDVDVADTGRLLLRDQVGLGRAGQAGGDLTCRTALTWAGRPALVEELELGAWSYSAPGVLGGARLVDSVTALGWRPSTAPSAGTVFSLPEPGALARQLLTRAHDSAMAGTWRAWRGELPSF